jgi:multidrug efflux pump subunit AcrA (membrane-fusion protein)
VTFGLLLGVFGVAGAVLLWKTGTLFAKAPYSGPTFTVRKERLKITIVARGSLESAKNGDVVCTVRAGQKGSTNSTVIKWLVDAGTEVNKGQQIMELDSSGFVEQLKDQNIKVDQARATMEKADADYETQKLDNETDIEKAINAHELAKIDLEKYVKGDFEQALKDVDGRTTTAKSDLDDWKDRAAWSARMVKKGLMSKVQAEADANRVEASMINLKKLEEEKRVLVDYTKGRTIQDLTAKLAEAKRGVEKTKGQAKAKLASFDANRLAQKSVYEQELSRKGEIEAEIKKCDVRAPQDGLVVYYVPEQAMKGGGAQNSVVAQGEPVREGQKMIQIPDLSQMLVNVRVPEAFVSHLHSEDPDDKSTRQHAQIRVDAFPNRILKGHVKTVDTVASQTDWFNADVKVYKTMVSISNPNGDLLLKPGMSAEVTISAQESHDPVIVVPVQSVIGTISMGANRKCFVVRGDGQTELRDIVVGMSNERLVEVISGLEVGEKVVENPRPLMSDDTEMKPGKVRTKSEGEQDSGSTGSGQKKGKKKGSGGAPPGTQPPGGPTPGGPTPGVPTGPKGPNGGTPSAEAQQKTQEFMARFQAASPTERRDMINQLPEAYREGARKKARDSGLQVAD